MRPTALALALALVPLAGCISPSADEVAPAVLDAVAADPWPAVQAKLADVPCEAPVGPGTSANLLDFQIHALDDVVPAPAHGEADFVERADGRALAAVARYLVSGVDLVDVADPLAPVLLASWEMYPDGAEVPNGKDRALDVKFTADGMTVLVAGDHSIKLVDVRDPAAPRLESEYVLEAPQAHMLTVFETAGAEWVAAPKGEGYDLAIYRIDGEPGARALERVATPSLTLLGHAARDAPSGEKDLLRSHDAWFWVDPITGTPTLWVANVWDGVAALDVTDPAAPKLLAKWTNFGPYQGYTHTVQATVLDGRRLVVSVSELGADALQVWDATDLANPRLVGVWHVPLLAKPQHNLQIVGERAYVAHYDEGTFVFDLREAGAGPAPTWLDPVAHLAPTSVERTGAGGTLSAIFAGVWDVVVHRGVVWTTELGGGLRSTGYGCLWPGDEGASSTG